MSLRDVTIAQMGNRDRECEWRHALEVRGGFGEFWRKLVEFQDLRKTVDFWAGPGHRPCGRCRTRLGEDGKVIIERLYIFLPYVETFNSKVIKGFVPELRSHRVFFVFRDSYVLCIYVMNILCTFRISVSGYGTHIEILTQPQLGRNPCLTLLDRSDLVVVIIMILFFFI